MIFHLKTPSDKYESRLTVCGKSYNGRTYVRREIAPSQTSINFA